ncbi:hypothetical protein ABZX77_17940 [Streptomyces sp. NPDC004237]|uniref:hypothetical protein n=1 Tax=Streptomyces sp. NPDC004237 TaxID=3154455 RepID=UPI0033A49B99
MPPTPQPAEVPGKPLVTAGRQQLLVECPHCAGVHRHLEDGIRRGPCGATYTVMTYRPEQGAS